MVNSGSSPISLNSGAFNLTISGLEIRGGNGSQGYALIYLYHAASLVLDNLIVHDSYNNDLIRILHCDGDIYLQNSVLYNPELPEEAVDINGGSHGIYIVNNIFFNDYADATSSRPLVFAKTSNLTSDGITRDIHFTGNIFLARDSTAAAQAQLQIGGDDKTWYTCEQCVAENNLFVASDGNGIGFAILVRGARDVVVRANTITRGGGSYRAFGLIDSSGSRPISTNVVFENNIFYDPISRRFIDGTTDDVSGGVVNNNLYWVAPLITSGDALNYTDDNNRVVADPFLPSGGQIEMPTWDGHQFTGGYTSARDLFVDLVNRYAIPAAGGPVTDAASSNMPTHDILGRLRGGVGDIGAYEIGGDPIPPTPIPPTPTPGSGGLVPFGQAVVDVDFETNGPGSNIDTIAFWQAPMYTDSLMFVSSKDVNLVEVYTYPFSGQPTSLSHGCFVDGTNGVAVDQDILYVTVQRSQNVCAFSLPSMTYLQMISENFRQANIDGGVTYNVEPNLTTLALADGSHRIYITNDHPVYIYSDTGVMLDTYTPSPHGAIEALAGDNYHQLVYIPDEDGVDGVYAYTPAGVSVGHFGTDAIFNGDAEGILVYDCGNGEGLIVISDQIASSSTGNDFEFFNRSTWEYLGNVKLRVGNSYVYNTDGIASFQYGSGLFAAVNHDATVVGVSWDAIMASTGLSCQ